MWNQNDLRDMAVWTVTIDVVVLTKSPTQGRVKTRLAAAIGVAEATALHVAMVWETLDRVRRSGANVRVSLADSIEGDFARALRAADYAVEAQVAGDLGRRLSHALRHSGRQLALGTDCVTFDPAWITLAGEAKELVCMGPTDDGGYWAIGGCTESADLRAALFDGMEWSTSTVAAETSRRLTNGGVSLRLLPRSYDIDILADLQRLAADEGCPARIREWLRSFSVPIRR